MFTLISIIMVLSLLLNSVVLKLLLVDRAYGTIYVHETEEKNTYEQVLKGDPEHLSHVKRVTFKVAKAKD